MKRKKRSDLELADELFSLIIRTRDRYCQECGSSTVLQCAHGFPRGYYPTRWDDENAWALCRACHKSFTHRPLQWEDWMRRRMGDDAYEAKRLVAVNGPQTKAKHVLPSLRERWETMADA